MASSKVFFSSSRAAPKLNHLKKLERLYNRAGFGALFSAGDRTAVKIHWGEPGNTTFIPVPYVRSMVSLVKNSRAIPFVTDTNALYTGRRHDAVLNLGAAAFNGFTHESVGAPIIVADGLFGTDHVEIEVDGKYAKSARVASAIANAPSMLVLSHFKGHMLFSFGGALKNLGMGCATSAGKHFLHSDLKPRVNQKLCIGDGICVRHCPAGAIALGPDKKAAIDSDRCIGCGECVVVCHERAIPIGWKTSSGALQCKNAEYALAAVKNKREKVGFVNFLISITPDCDCAGWSDNRVVQDIGFLASTDPVAIDQASVDLFNASTPIDESDLGGKKGARDLLRALRPEIDYTILLAHAEQIGLGSRSYELVKVDA